MSSKLISAIKISSELIRQKFFRIKQILRKPPGIILRKIWQLGLEKIDRYYLPWRAKYFTLPKLLSLTRKNSLAQLWNDLGSQNYCSQTTLTTPELLYNLRPQASAKIIAAAQKACNYQVDLLGSGLLNLRPLDWLQDYKVKHRWPATYCKNIDYCNPELPSDVKFPWELSRWQWLFPVGQAYLLTGDEQYARLVKEILCSWIGQNPYGYTVNWSCTMEVALRIISLTWFFQVFKDSPSWNDPDFQFIFLRNLFLHAEFTLRHLEFSDINGNHCLANAAGLCFAGLFFSPAPKAQIWLARGWQILCQEIERQVFSDGVDFEASIAYQRLVTELFFYPACYREAHQLRTPVFYQEKLRAMAKFIQAYSRDEGSSPLVGDADDGRVFAFGTQGLNDHRYLSNLIAWQWKFTELFNPAPASLDEVFWVHGPQAVKEIAQAVPKPNKSQAFSHGGFYVLCNQEDHIFIDCGPVGLQGRGGHGHNDCLSFEAQLSGVLLITDCGSYVYTADYQQRNLFRSTAYHNTPQIDQTEINRFLAPNNLWSLHNDAVPKLIRWELSPEEDLFCGQHSGYQRLPSPLIVQRSLSLQHQTHQLTIHDDFRGEGSYYYQIPFHFAPKVQLQILDQEQFLLLADGQQFILSWHSPSSWQTEIQPAEISPSYGLKLASQKIIWTRTGKPASLTIKIWPLKAD